MTPCNRCKQLKRPDEMSKGKGHCKLCRNTQQNEERTYYRNDGLKAIPSRGMPT